MLLFVCGMVVGMVIMAISMASLIVGKLCVVHDPDEPNPYLYLDVDAPDIGAVINRKYVIFRVSRD